MKEEKIKSAGEQIIDALKEMFGPKANPHKLNQQALKIIKSAAKRSPGQVEQTLREFGLLIREKLFEIARGRAELQRITKGRRGSEISEDLAEQIREQAANIDKPDLHLNNLYIQVLERLGVEIPREREVSQFQRTVLKRREKLEREIKEWRQLARPVKRPPRYTAITKQQEREMEKRKSRRGKR